MRSCGNKLSKLIQPLSTKHFHTHTHEKRTSNAFHGNSVKADSRLIAHACEDCHHSFTTKSNLYRHNRICSHRLANVLHFPDPPVASPQSFSFVYEDPSRYRRRRRRRAPELDQEDLSRYRKRCRHRAPESDQELIGLSNEYMNDEDHHGSKYDVDTDEANLAYHEGQGERPHSTGAYHPHQYLPYHVPDHVRVDTRPTNPHIHQQLCDATSAAPSTESLPHPWTTANPYTIDAPADESHYGYSKSHEWGSVGAPPMEKPYSTPLMGSATQPNAISHIADGQGQAGSSLGVTHPYHPLQYMQPNWHDEQYYCGYGNHQVTWTLAAYLQLVPMQYDIHNACGPHDVCHPHYG